MSAWNIFSSIIEYFRVFTVSLFVSLMISDPNCWDGGQRFDSDQGKLLCVRVLQRNEGDFCSKSKVNMFTVI